MRVAASAVIALVLACSACETTDPPAKAPTTGVTTARAADASRAWIAKSNENTKLLLDVFARFAPEFAAQIGVDGVDEGIMDVTPGHRERSMAAVQVARTEIVQRIATEQDPLVKQDLEILARAADLEIRRSRAEWDTLVPYTNPTELIFMSFHGLLDEQIPPARRKAAVVRLRKYAGLEPGYRPFTELLKTELVDGMSNPALVKPQKMEIERHMTTNAQIRQGLRGLFAKYPQPGADEPLAKLIAQLEAFDAYVKETVLPQARTDYALPPADLRAPARAVRRGHGARGARQGRARRVRPDPERDAGAGHGDRQGARAPVERLP